MSHQFRTRKYGLKIGLLNRSIIIFLILSLPTLAANTFETTGGTVAEGYWNSTNTGATATFDVPNDATIRNATIQVSVNGGDYDVVGSAFSIAAVNVEDSRGIANNDIEGITGFAEGAILTFKVVYLLSNFTASGHESSLLPANVTVYNEIPDTGTTGSVTTVGGTVSSGYWNPTNTSATITTPIPNDDALQSGILQIQAYGSGAGTWVDVGSSSTIAQINTTKNISIPSADITGLGGYEDGNSIFFRAVLTDIAINPDVEYNQSGTTLTVDTTSPATVNTGNVTTTGSNIVADYWNSNNNDVLVVVPVPAGDATLVDGYITIEARINAGLYTAIGDNLTIASAGNKTVTITRAQFDNLPYGTSDVITFRAVITDRAGNSTDGNDSGTTLTINEEQPTISSISSATGDGAIKGVGEDIVIDVSLSKNVTLSGGSILVTLETGSTDRTVSYSAALADASSFQVTYTVQSGDESSDLNIKSVALSGGSLVDDFGNDANLSNPISNLANNNAFVVDAIGPSIDQITATEANGYFGVDDEITLEIHFSENVSMATGTLEIELETGSGTDRVVSVLANAINNTAIVYATYSVEAGETSSDLNINSVTEVGGILVDQVSTGADLSLPGGSNLADLKNLTIDTTYPDAVQVGSVSTTGGVIVSGKWNSSNQNINVVLSIPNDATLVDGNVQILAQIGVNAFVTIGSASNIVGTGTTKTIPITEAEFENDLSFSDDNILSFTADVTDRAGNTTRWTTSGTTLTADQTAPTISSVTSTPDVTVLEEDMVANIMVTFNEDVTLAGGVLDFNLDVAATTSISSAATSNTVFTATYTVAIGDQSPDLNVTSLSLTGSLRDAAGNNANLSIPNDSELQDNSDLEVDAVAPTISSIASNSGNGPFGLGRTVSIALQFNEPVTLLNDNIELILETGQNNRTITISPFSDSQNAYATYTVQSGDNSSDLEVLSLSLAGTATLRDARSNNADLSIPANQNLDDNSTVVIETTAPDAFTVGEVVAVGAPIVSGYWNANNTSLNVTVPIPSDATLAGGTLQLRGQVSSNAFADLGSSRAVPTAGISQTVELTEVEFEDLVFPDGSTVTIKAILTDNAGNQTTGTASANLIVIDQTIPTLSNISSDPAIDSLKLGESIDITVDFSENVTLSAGNIVTTLETGTTDREITTAVLSNSDVYTITYDVQAGEENTDLSIQSIALGAGTLRDAAGNNVDFTQPLGESLADNSAIRADGILPADFAVGSITADGGTVIVGYWNNTNTSLLVTVPIADDSSLLNGTIQLMAIVSGGAYEELGTVQNIPVKNITQEIEISALVFEGLTGFADNKTLTIKAVITDVVGNETEGSASATTISIDQTAPTITEINSAPSSGNLKIGESTTIELTFSEEVILGAGGELVTTLETGGADAELSSAPFTNTTVDEVYTVVAGEESSDLTVSLVTLASGNFRDTAGNNVVLGLPVGDNLADNSSVTVDGIVPSITSITSSAIDGDYGIDETISVTVTFNEALTMAGGDFILTLETGSTDRTINFAQFTDEAAVTGNYTIQSGDVSGDLTGKSLTISGGTLRDASLYDANLDLPTGSNLADSRDLNIDGIVPVAFAIGDVVPTGGTVASTYWNSTNTSILVTVPIASDASLNSGEVQIIGRTNLANDYENLGMAIAILASGANQNVSIPSAALAALDGFTDGVSLYISAILSDIAGNETTGSQSAVLLTVDQTSPTISSITSSPVADSLALGDNIDVTLTWSENVTLSGVPLETTFETGSPDRTVSTTTLIDVDNYDITYTVQESDASIDLEVLSVVVGGTLRDAAGNDADLSINAGNTLSGNSAIVVDGTLPSDFTVGSITSVGGTVTSGYWNSGNTSIQIDIPLENDPSLQGGTIQINTRVGGNAYEDLGGVIAIPSSNTTQIVTIEAADLEAISGFAEGTVLFFNAVISDAVGNSKTGTASVTQLSIDQVAPEVLSITSNPVPGHLSVGESSVITFNFTEAVTLSGGNLIITFDTDAQITRIALNGVDTYDETYTVSEDEVSSDLNVSSIALSSGNLRDAAGNDIAATDLDLTLPVGANLSDNSALIVDGVIPTLLSITSTSDDASYYSEDDEIDLVLTFSENITLSGANLELTLETGGIDQVLEISTIANDDTATVTYTVIDGDASDDLSANDIALVIGGVLTDAAGNNVVLDIPAGNNLDDVYDFVVDGSAPADFTVGTVIASGGNVFTDYYNSTNTSVEVTVPIANDASLQNGEVQLSARVGANAYENIGDPSSILTVNAQKNISVSSAVIEAITGFGEDLDITFNAVITDSVGNSTTGTASGNIIAIDQAIPALSSITSVLATDNLSVGESSVITFNFTEAVTLSGGNLIITFDTDAQITRIALNGVDTYDETYTVSEDEVSSDLNVSSIALSSGNLRDAAGNDIAATDLDLTLPVGANLSDNSALIVDGVIPTLLSITSTSDDASYYSEDDEIDLVLTFSENITLSGANLELTLETGGIDQVLEISTIANDDTATVTYTVIDGDASDDLSANDIALVIGGVLTDAAGNNVVLDIPAGNNLDDVYDFVVDGSAPADFTVGTVIASGGNVFTDYYNSTNTSVEVTVPIANDASLQNGEVQLSARVGANAYENIGDPSLIIIIDANKIVSLNAAEVESLTGFTEGVSLTFTAVVSDIVGNTTTGTESASVLSVDQVIPTLTSINSDPTADDLGIGETATLTLNFSETVTLVGGDLVTTLETGDVDAVLTTILVDSLQSVSGEYTVLEGEISDDLEVSSIALSAGTLRDVAGNDVDATLLELTLPVGSNLADNSALMVDGVVPSIMNISSALLSDSLGLGEIITIDIEFSKLVTLAGGELVLTFETGLVDEQIRISDFNSLSTVSDVYEVLVGDESLDLTLASIVLDGGTLVDVAGNNVTLDIPLGSNLSDNNDILVDGILPDVFTTGDIVTLGDPVVPNYWNLSNTTFEVTLPNPGSDASLDGGFSYLEARINANDFVPIGDTSAVGTNSITLSILRTQLENNLPGYFGSGNIEVRGVMTDIAGNQTVGASSSNMLMIDITTPAVTTTGNMVVAGGDEFQGYWNPTNLTLTVFTDLDTDNSLIGGTIQLQARIGAGAYLDIGSDSTISANNTSHETVLTASDFSDYGILNGDIIDIIALVSDVALNRTIGLPGANTLIFDSEDPGAFTLETVTTTGDPIVENYFNDGNDGVEISVPINPLDNTLLGGSVQLRVSVDGAAAEDFLAPVNIENLTSIIVPVTRAELEAVVGYGEGVILTFHAIITDVAGNTTQGFESLNQLEIDTLYPTSTVSEDIRTLGSNPVTGYWNDGDTDVLIKVPIDISDASLVGGTFTVFADLTPPLDDSFERIPSIQNILSLGSDTISIQLPASEIEALEEGTGFTDGLEILFQTVITDVAGNSTTSTTSAITYHIDQAAPTEPTIDGLVVLGANVISGVWNAGADSLLMAVPTDIIADSTINGGFIQVLMSVGDTFDENSYELVVPDSFLISETSEDTIRLGSSDIVALANFQDLKTIYTRMRIQDQAGNVTTSVTSVHELIIDIAPPENFISGTLIATGGTVIEDAYNNANTGIELEVPIADDPSLLNGSAILKVSLTNLSDLPFVASPFENIDTVVITNIDTILSLTLDHDQLSALTSFSPNYLLMATASLLDYAGNETEGSPSTNELTIDLRGPDLPIINDTTTTGDILVAGYWNASNTGIDITVATPATVATGDTSLIGGYFQVQARIGLEPTFTDVGEPVSMISPNDVELTANIDSVILETLPGFGEDLLIDLQILMVDGRGNDTLSAVIEDWILTDQVAPSVGAFIPEFTTENPFINAEDSLLAKWDGFSDATTSIANYEYSVGDAPSGSIYINWMEIDTTFKDTMLVYNHGDEHYINVRAVDVAGNVSDIISGTALVADLESPNSTSLADEYYLIDEWLDVNSFGGTYDDGLAGVDTLWFDLSRESDNRYWDGADWIADSTVLEIDITTHDGFWNYSISSDTLTNHENYFMRLMAVDSAGNRQATASLDTFQFIINSPPELFTFEDDTTTLEDSLFAYQYYATDPDFTTTRGDSMFYTLSETAPDGILIDLRTGLLSWVPVDSAVGDHIFTTFVTDLLGLQDSVLNFLTVINVNDAPEPVTLLLPADSTQILPVDSLLLTLNWTPAFDIEDNLVSYQITMQGSDYDTMIATIDTFLVMDVSVMDFPPSPIEWFVHALDAEDISDTSAIFKFTTSAASAELSTHSITVAMQRNRNTDTLFTIANKGLTDLRWSLADAPSWLTMVTESGIIQFQDSAAISFNINPTDSTIGGFGDTLRLATNDPLQDTISVAVSVGIFDIPAPVLAFYKNPVYPGFYEMMIVDSLGMIDTLTLSYTDEEIHIDTIGAYTYLATIEIANQGLSSFELYASNWVGDTTIVTSISVSLAKSGANWLARSPDSQFEIRGTASSARYSSQFAILDTVLSLTENARYKVLSDGVMLAGPVLVSMPVLETEQAIYIQDVTGHYVELPSMSDGNRVSAWAERLGAFNLGPRTIIIPERSQLSQNYPNPFNPTTTIDYDIGFLDGLNQYVEFNIYNIRGQEIRNLVKSQLQPGHYSIIWNGLNDHGQQVSSGIYFARLTTGKGYVKTVKMLVLR